MTKMIKTTDAEMRIDTSSILVVEIGDLSFEKDERYFWIDVYTGSGENKKFITQIDEDDTPILIEREELKRYCLNWYFNNVEIIEKVEEL